MQAVADAPVAAPRDNLARPQPFSRLLDDPPAEFELGPLGEPHPLVYVHTEDREALDVLILAGLISP